MDTFSFQQISPRKADSHKGDYGKVLVIAGSETMIGAPAIVAQAACRAGAGLVRVAAPKDILPQIISLCPSATGFAFSGAKIKELLAFADEHDCLAVGPGLGQSPTIRRLIIELLERHRGPMVLDADALNALASLETSEWPKRRDWSNVVLTPHMGEYMRLMSAVMKRGGAVADLNEKSDAGAGIADAEESLLAASKHKVRSLAGDESETDDLPCTADGIALDIEPESAPEPAPQKPAVQAEPQEPSRAPLAELLAKGTGAVVVLKGDHSVITDGNRVAINTTGNPAMATAGSGDALTGIIAAFLGGSTGSKLSALEAATLGVHVHGLAGDIARDEIIGPGVLAGGLMVSDIITRVPKAVASLVK